MEAAMSENLDTINKLISEHHDVRETVELPAESLTDIEALFVLRRAYADWAQCASADLATKKDGLIDTLAAVAEGLKKHWSFEENALRPIFGEVLCRAFMHEHSEVGAQLENAKQIVKKTSLEGLEQQELLSCKTSIQDALNRVLQAIEEHANHEDVIFKMIKNSLETTQGS
jgi:hypothetical protein